MTSLHSVDRHPGQPHIVATGSGDGVLGIWDLRQEKSPVSLLEAHAGPGQYHVQSTTGARLVSRPVVPWLKCYCTDIGELWHELAVKMHELASAF